MAKKDKRTKAELLEEIAKLRGLVTAVGGWPKEPTLEEQIADLEQETLEEVRRSCARHQLEIGSLIHNCMEKTGRPLGMLDVHKVGEPPEEDPYEALYFKPWTENNGLGPCLRHLAKAAAGVKYSFKDYSVFEEWARKQLLQGWREGRKSSK